MKTPLKFILLLAGALVLATPVLRADDQTNPPPADQPNPAGPGHGHRGRGAMMEHLAQELGLSADQESKWKEIGQQERAAIKPIYSDTSLSREERRAKMKEVNQTYAEQRRVVLNPDQQKKFDELRARMREHGPRKPETQS